MGSTKEIRKENGYYSHGGNISDKEVDHPEQAGAELEGSSVCEFLSHCGLFHLPSGEKHEEHASEAHQEVGSEFVAEIENSLPEELESRQGPEGQ